MSVKKITRLIHPKKVGKKPLKRSMTGYETENFILDESGNVDNSDKLLKKAKAKKLPVNPECAKGMIEMICLPHKKLSSTSLSLIDNLINLDELAKEEGFRLYPFATYPGAAKPVFRKSKWYRIQQKILGEKQFENAGLCCGYHQHYALPKGVFDKKTRFLKYEKHSKVKRTLIDSYNLLNAIDPIMTLFLQSSPYVNNKSLAKDSRVVLYRSGRKLNHKTGLYARHQFFGGLSPYKQTLKDLISSIKRRSDKWKKLLIKHGIDPDDLKSNKNILKFAWNPVKINPIGTLEYRGGDMNLLSNIFGAATMIKFALKKIQQDFLIVIPADLELSDAFRVEGKFMFIPPHSLVRKELQPASAYEGYGNKRLVEYAQSFLNFVKKEVNEKYKPLLAPISEMLDKKKSVSDMIIRNAKRAGYMRSIPQSFAKELALKYSEEFGKDLLVMRKKLEKIDVDGHL